MNHNQIIVHSYNPERGICLLAKCNYVDNYSSGSRDYPRSKNSNIANNINGQQIYFFYSPRSYVENMKALEESKKCYIKTKFVNHKILFYNI